MTAILGLVHGGNVYIGGDRNLVDGSHTVRFTSRVPKIITLPQRKGKAPRPSIVVGTAGSLLGLQAVRLGFDPPPKSKDESTYHYIASKVAPHIVELCLGAEAFEESDTEIESVVGCNGEIFTVCHDGSVVSSVHSYAHAGSGRIGLGALYVFQKTAQKGLSPVDWMADALRVSSQLESGVSPPFDVIRLTPTGELEAYTFES